MNQQLYKISEIELVYKPTFKSIERPRVNSAEDVYNLLMQYWSQDRIELVEEFKIILMNNNNAVLGIVNIAIGGMSNVGVDPKVIFAAALKGRASRIVLAHNHPSSELVPSNDDIRMTDQLKRGAYILGLEIVDHLIISPNGFYSFTNDGV